MGDEYEIDKEGGRRFMVEMEGVFKCKGKKELNER